MFHEHEFLNKHFLFQHIPDFLYVRPTNKYKIAAYVNSAEKRQLFLNIYGLPGINIDTRVC